MTQRVPRFYAIGWDVGAWHCDRNGSSRDAIVILDDYRSFIGMPWRGNLRETIGGAPDSTTFLDRLFDRCEVKRDHAAAVTLAIDAPLAFSQALTDLIAGRAGAEPGHDRKENAYLFRATERWLFQHGHRPLSAVQDMIGSQATKAMHALAKFAPQIERCGVWTDGKGFRAIETYPTICKTNALVANMLADFDVYNADLRDALVCATIALMFQVKYGELEAPGDGIPVQEGWIWYPKGCEQSKV